MSAPTLQNQRQALMRRLDRRISSEGKITLPAVPSLLDDYVARCEGVFTAAGRKLDQAQRDHLRGVLAKALAEAFSRSQRSTITVSYTAPVAEMLRYTVTPDFPDLAQIYENWIKTRKPPYFGVHADAKVMVLARELEDPRQCPVLDIGAGTGRNALALARLGHPVDAVELTPQFAHTLTETAASEALPVRVIGQDVFQSRQLLRNDYRLIVVSEVVPDFRSVDEWRRLLELAAATLCAGGKLVVNVFVAREHYYSDEAAREFAQQVYSFFMTPAELSLALEGLSLKMISSEDAYHYEKTQLPEGAWPPTAWYPDWTSGRDIFDLPRTECPVSMWWLVLQKIADNNRA